ncbi:MAG: transposase [Candidatus Omnitrophica bacterium]|nr:transposase [Candidatus Omnitrophota bacterium]
MDAPIDWRIMMSRAARSLRDGGCYYIQTQSYRNQKIFKMDLDYEQYIQLIRKYKLKFKVNVYAYCLTPASVHLIVKPHHMRGLSAFMQGLSQSYALFFNRRYNGMGKVWGQRYKSVLFDENHDLYRYMKSIEFIPVEERRVDSPVEYPWSSCTNRVLGPEGIIDLVVPSGMSVNKSLN